MTHLTTCPDLEYGHIKGGEYRGDAYEDMEGKG